MSEDTGTFTYTGGWDNDLYLRSDLMHIPPETDDHIVVRNKRGDVGWEGTMDEFIAALNRLTGDEDE